MQRKRATYLLVAAGVVAGLVGVQALVVLGGGRPGEVSGLAASVGPTRDGLPAVTVPPSPSRVPDPMVPAGATVTPGDAVTEPVAEAIPRLKKAFEHALQKAAPGAVMNVDEPPFEIQYDAEREFPMPGEGDSNTFMSVYLGSGYVRWHGRPSMVSVHIGWGAPLDIHCPTDWHDCRERTTATGERVMSWMLGYEGEELSGDPDRSVEERLSDSGFLDTTISFGVQVDRADGSHIRLASSPASPDDSVASRIPTIDRAVLETIALDPGLTVHP